MFVSLSQEAGFVDEWTLLSHITALVVARRPITYWCMISRDCLHGNPTEISLHGFLGGAY